MISTHWLKRRRDHWTRLQHLLERCERGSARSLDRGELQELAVLYRQAAADLSILKQDRSGSSYYGFLEQMLRRAHNVIYAGEQSRRGGVLRFFTQDYPAVVRRHASPIGVALALFLFSALVGWLTTLRDPDFALRVLGPHMIETIEKREMWTHSVVAVKPWASSMIMTNNLSVAFSMFALGITGAVGTVAITIFNGLLLGVVGSACALNGMSVKLWSFVAPHGALELPAIVIAAGAGLRLGSGLLFPGYLPRRDSVAQAGADAVRLLLGVIPILVIAGIIEGFLSPLELPPAMKFSTGGLLLLLLVAYLWSGQGRPAAH